MHAPKRYFFVFLKKIRKFSFIAVLLLFWQYVSTVYLDSSTRILLPPPTAILPAARDLIVSGTLLRNAGDSLRREIFAFLWATSAIPIAIAMSWWPWIEEQLDPLMGVLRPIPPLAWIPLSILWFGIGDVQNQFIIFLAIFFPILINTISGVKTVDPNLIRAGRCLGAKETNILLRVVLIAALPQIVTGIRIGLGVGWMALVAAELVGATSGLGFMINDARSILRTDYVIVGMITIGIIGLLIDLTILNVYRLLLPWSRS
ncbi:MAG: ABC transporter permease [Candidimonas sp.]|nr:MAG: ABC transporter permease [Candidimonas sp.]TAM21700.1 MAG: ABC transporter permease [Candidimonas sp.]TAM77650.1 MAG: ABC transporter permease [Candidimonas sp.]